VNFISHRTTESTGFVNANEQDDKGIFLFDEDARERAGKIRPQLR
jgi:hypothetical protein